MVYADDVNTLGGSVHTVKVKAESIVFASKESGLDVCADKPKHIIILRDQNAGPSHNT